jgi:hypothetical protein
MLPDLERADRIGEFWGHSETRTFGELLIDLEEDKAAREVVKGLSRSDGGQETARASLEPPCRGRKS